MDLPCVQWQDHVAQKWTGLDPELKERFTSLREIDDVFKCALTLTTQDNLDFLQCMSAGYSVQKDPEQAAKCREKGNSSFKIKDYRAAALHYSQGVCFAPQSSEQLSMCYANRSAALYHLQHYKESLADIDKALKNGYPSHLVYKLEDRRTQCLKHHKAKLDHHSPALKNHQGPDITKEPSVLPFTFGICPQVAVGFSTEKGRQLVAAERIAPGKVILIDRPYSCVLIPGMKEVRGQETEKGVFGTEHTRCHRCLTQTLCPVPCEGCSYSRYCSTSCQQDAWEEHHHWECPLGADLMAMGVMSQLALRVALKAGLKNIQMAKEAKEESTKSGLSCSNSDCRESSNCNPCHTNPNPILYYGDSYLSVFHLSHHLSHHSPGMRFLCAVTVATLYLKLSKTGPPPASWDLSRHSRDTSQLPDGAEEEGGISDWSPELWPLGSAVLRHILQLRCNAQAILMLQDTGTPNSSVQSSKEIRIATAIFPTLSLLNHSCCPNTSLVFSTGDGADLSRSDLSADSENVAEYSGTACGVAVTVRAAKAIAPGQEILHCYGPHSSRMVTQERVRLLQEQYYFLCQCEACAMQEQEEEKEEEEEEDGAQNRHQWSGGQHKSGLLCSKCKAFLKKCSKDKGNGFVCIQSACGHHMSYSELSHRLQEIREDLEKAVVLMERERPDEALRLLKRIERQSGLILAETHPLQGELADTMARAYATMGDWNNAASHLERSAVAIGSQYGEDSIEMGRQLFKLAQLHFNGGARGPALSVIPKARCLLRLYCGPHCHEIQELQAMEDCLRG